MTTNALLAAFRESWGSNYIDFEFDRPGTRDGDEEEDFVRALEAVAECATRREPADA